LLLNPTIVNLRACEKLLVTLQGDFETNLIFSVLPIPQSYSATQSMNSYSNQFEVNVSALQNCPGKSKKILNN
jgi:hypothetical protein